MKAKIFVLTLFIISSVFAQSEILFYKDTLGNLSYKEVQKKPFQLLEKQILEPHSNSVYWFKIPKDKSKPESVFRILYERIRKADAYQASHKIKELSNQRFLSYQFSRKADVYIKVAPKLHAYIPVTLNSAAEANIKENKHVLLNGFYYGFAFLVVIYNLFYYFIFKDDAFLYYALFLTSMSFGVFTMDGMLNFFNLNHTVNDVLMILNYIFLAFFSSKFTNNYLFLELYYPKIKRLSYVLGICIVISGVLYLVIDNYYYLLILNLLVFLLLFIYWLCSVLLFRKNMYTKILAIAYIIILFSAIDFFVLKFLGISLININSTNIKIGAFSEMIILSIAVLYRMKTLRDENDVMRKEIVEYSEELSQLKIENEDRTFSRIDQLSLRERQIFDLIVQLKSNKEIATILNVSINTVKFHVKNIYEKLSIRSRKEALSLQKI
ncbi:hypothetical protein DUT90_06960 [Polaribacter sp. WD7]|uniref:7TM diverse intracellular signaling domain-containing protein n=1 Tax=Polaribacter sp. WD7 TaxID=2269061 RepID=UPI000DF28A6A|nr:7TM diverse intracellular signaling domain-containing protein [Polaribacter sp. WD7]RCS26860.1 hypothetical protein DUT90_06960 [Polaribacter sp. WD7]